MTKPTVPSVVPSLGSLDFPADRTSLRINEVAQKLSVSHAHVQNLIDVGALQTVCISTDLNQPRAKRRITIDSYRKFIRDRLTP